KQSSRAVENPLLARAVRTILSSIAPGEVRYASATLFSYHCSSQPSRDERSTGFLWQILCDTKTTTGAYNIAEEFNKTRVFRLRQNSRIDNHSEKRGGWLPSAYQQREMPLD